MTSEGGPSRVAVPLVLLREVLALSPRTMDRPKPHRQPTRHGRCTMTDQDVTEGREQCENILATVHIARQQIYELVAANRLTRIDAAKLLVDSYAVEGEAQGALLLYGGAA